MSLVSERVIQMKKSQPSVVESWTKARYFTFIRSALRKAWSKFPNKYEVQKEGRKKMTGETGREVFHQQCNHCKRWFEMKYMTVDHIEPCGQLTEYEHLPAFVAKLFCGTDNLQNLCNYKLADKDKFEGVPSCHYMKSQVERKRNENE